MKLLVVIFCLVVSGSALAQGSDTTHQIETMDSLAKHGAVFFVDEKPSNSKVNEVNPSEIVSKDILKQDKTKLSVDGEIASITVLVVTKTFAIQQYQKKFAAPIQKNIKPI